MRSAPDDLMGEDYSLAQKGKAWIEAREKVRVKIFQQKQRIACCVGAGFKPAPTRRGYSCREFSKN
ncbi:MAG: hypothetical protein HUU08_02570 [Candidatus Brocadia sp.]|nr:hypothetical protein [Candidatus Brocadia sp.]